MFKQSLMAIGIAMGGWGLAHADAKLAESKQCMQCHKADQDWAGPAYSKIKAKWKGKADAESKLVATIRRGSESTGGPHWGPAKMPNDAERPLVSEAEAKRLVKWILGS